MKNSFLAEEIAKRLEQLDALSAFRTSVFQAMMQRDRGLITKEQCDANIHEALRSTNWVVGGKLNADG